MVAEESSMRSYLRAVAASLSANAASVGRADVEPRDQHVMGKAMRADDVTSGAGGSGHDCALTPAPGHWRVVCVHMP